MWKLIDVPQQTVPFLRERLKPVRATDPHQVRRLLAELNGETVAGREKASKDLEGLADRPLAALQQALENKPPPEVRQRIEVILTHWTEPVPPGALLQGIRAIEVLEQIDTPEALAVVRRVAEGVAEAPLTREAKATLRRLGQGGATDTTTNDKSVRKK
jgi:hypothetical protein